MKEWYYLWLVQSEKKKKKNGDKNAQLGPLILAN